MPDLPDLPDLSDTAGSYYKISYRRGADTGSFYATAVDRQGDWIVMKTYPFGGDGPRWDIEAAPTWLLRSEVVSIQKLKQIRSRRGNIPGEQPLGER